MDRVGTDIKGKRGYPGDRADAVIDTQIKTVIQLHNVLHQFFIGRGAGTAKMELN